MKKILLTILVGLTLSACNQDDSKSKSTAKPNNQELSSAEYNCIIMRTLYEKNDETKKPLYSNYTYKEVDNYTYLSKTNQYIIDTNFYSLLDSGEFSQPEYSRSIETTLERKKLSPSEKEHSFEVQYIYFIEKNGKKTQDSNTTKYIKYSKKLSESDSFVRITEITGNDSDIVNEYTINTEYKYNSDSEYRTTKTWSLIYNNPDSKYVVTKKETVCDVKEFSNHVQLDVVEVLK